MKKMYTWLVTAMLIMAMLTGCGTDKDVAGKVTPNENQSTASSAEAETEVEKKVSLGRIEGGVYTNSYSGFGCELDSNWTFYSAEELQTLPDNISEILEGTEAGDLMSEYTQIVDMKAENANDNVSITVTYTKLDTASQLAYRSMSEEKIIDATLAQKDLMISSYAQAGIEVSAFEKVEVEFLGQKHFAIHMTATTDDRPVFMLQLFDYPGRYGVAMALTSFWEDNTQDLLSLFYKVD